MIAHRKTVTIINGKPFLAIVPLRVVDGIVEDNFGTASIPAAPCPRTAASSRRATIWGTLGGRRSEIMGRV